MANVQIDSGMQAWRYDEIIIKAFSTSPIYPFFHAEFVLCAHSNLLHCSMTLALTFITSGEGEWNTLVF